MKDFYHIYNFVEMIHCEFLCIVGVKVAQSQGKIKKNCGLLQDTNKHFLTKYFVRTGNLRCIGKQQNDSLFTKVTKYWR